MDLFNSNNIKGRSKDAVMDRQAVDFKHFAESKMNEAPDRFVGYSDETAIGVLKEEFSMYKNASPSKEGKVEAKKSKIPSFKSIADALKTAEYGQIFTTAHADRIYVITRGTWGGKSNDKVVKGFPTSTDMEKIRTYSKRTKVKHGGSSIDSLDKDEVTPTMLKKKTNKDKFKRKK
jgi:hypothetical protein